MYRVFGSARLQDGRIAIVNQGSQELRYFSADGVFLTASGGEGEGPGEFKNAYRLYRLPGDTLLVGDFRPWELEVFAPDGSWVRQIRPIPQYPNPPRASGLLSDGRMVFAGENFRERQPDFSVNHLSLVLHDRDGAWVDTLGVVPNGRLGRMSDDPGSVWIFPWFESFAQLTAAGDRLIRGHGVTPQLEIYAPDPERLERVVRWTGPDRIVRSAHLETARKDVIDRYVDLEPGRRDAIVDPLIDASRPAADLFPAFIGVVVGTDEAIWVREYPMPEGPETGEWIRFRPDGGFSCRASLPSGFDVQSSVPTTC